MKTTLFDLNKSAFAAAEKAFKLPPLEKQQCKLACFLEAGHDSRDFPTWETMFTTHADTFVWMSAAPSPASALDASQPTPAE